MTDDDPSNGRPSIPDNEIIERFGGIRPMASKLGVAVTTVQGWKERGHIPTGRFQQIAAAAAEHGVDLNGGKTTPPKDAAAPQAHIEAPAEERPAAPAPPAEPVEEHVSPPAEAPEPRASQPAPEPEPARRPDTVPAGRKAGGGVAWIALVFVVALSVAVVTRPLWEPVIHSGGGAGVAGIGSGSLGKIAKDLEALEDAVAELRRKTEAGSGDLDGRVTALEAGGGEAGEAFAGQLNDLESSMSGLVDSMGILSSSLRRIEQRLTDLELAGGQVPPPVQRAIGEIDGELDRLRSEIELWDESLKAQADALSENLGIIDSRLTELETRPLQTGKEIAAMALAIGQVEAALNSGEPFRDALNLLEALGRDDSLITNSEAISVLSPWADYGIPNRHALQREFAQITPEIDRALAAVEEKNWLDKVWNSVKGLVTIRRIGGTGDLPRVSKAEIAMEDGDLAAAKAAFDGAGSLGTEGDGWLNRVTARIDAEREIRSLYNRVTASLAGDAEPEAPPQ